MNTEPENEKLESEVLEAEAPKQELLQVLLYPDPFLRQVAEPVGDLTPEVLDDLKRKSALMLATMHAQNGVGLAATQVGFKERLFVMNVTGDPQDDFVLINPRITKKSGSEVGVEGCLSFPGILAKVKRAKQITIEANGLDGERRELSLEGGLVSRCIQHELEHLDGILFIDKISPANKVKLRKPLKALQAFHKAITKIKAEQKKVEPEPEPEPELNSVDK